MGKEEKPGKIKKVKQRKQRSTGIQRKGQDKTKKDQDQIFATRQTIILCVKACFAPVNLEMHQYAL